MLPTKIAGNGAKKNIPGNYHGMFNITGGWGGCLDKQKQNITQKLY
jgi:hypothetical protein